MEEEKKVTTGETLPDEVGVASSDGDNSADNDSYSESSAADNALRLDAINKELGKDFPTLDKALKAIKDTFSYVGKRQADEQKQIEDAMKSNPDNADILREIQELKDDKWFNEHAELKPYKETIIAMRKSGQPLDEVIESTAFSTVYEKAKVADEVESSKSVLQSNPKLGLVKSKIDESRKYMGDYNQAMRDGNATAAEQNFNSAKKSAVDSVKDLL